MAKGYLRFLMFLTLRRSHPRPDPVPDRLRDRLPARAAAGAHTAEVLEQELGLDATAIGTLRDQKVI